MKRFRCLGFNQNFRLLLKSSLLLIGGLTGPAEALTAHPTMPLDRAQQGMVTSAHPLATQVGLKILQQGGNAVDAAVATTLAISVVEPFSAGIGGGGFLLFHHAETGTMRSLDFRERAPLRATRDMYLDATGKVMPRASVDGYQAVGVPGTVAGLAAIHQRYGKLAWARLVAPSVQLAQQGFPVSARYQQALQWRSKGIKPGSEAAKIFLPRGHTPRIGDRIIQLDLAKTLAAVGQDPQNFYQGAIAQAIVRDMVANQGLISLADLRQYQPIWREPVCGEFHQHRVCSMPPPSSGGVHLLQMLHLIQAKDLKRWGWNHPNTLHRMIESMRIAYADRATHLGDPDFVKVPVTSLISPKYGDQRRSEIHPRRAKLSTQVKAATPAVLKQIQSESPETSHLTVVDQARNAVSLTFTVNLSFGAGVVAKGTGIVLNNEMDDFAVAPNTPNYFGLTGSQANAIAPRKTPLSSMTPTIITQDGQVRLAVGAPGGSTIITTVLQVILNTLVHDMDIKRAVAAPRLHHQWLPDQTRFDRWGFDPMTLAALERRGHQIKVRGPWGNANGIQLLPDGTLLGAADPRGEGIAAGY
ncbi:gamma-glutamyltransferase [filamentous cyanobacterium LEGE 11480]|uniref:Glutathione hydrolase proenzyme n=1 Tax=Romeriopsis navalis LEGE 11480 TaxID=2777977 RepID=A0A928VSY1_9CYAN|nr:gamma-glutamyltransferase [Romeriopsis navalis]MBE9031509.1 gamma-glutamyltransferase [Romeriopsis navalis LEGE 11480]